MSIIPNFWTSLSQPERILARTELSLNESTMSIENSTTAIGSCKLLLPPQIYAVPGQEVNIYFDNIVQATHPDRYLYDVTCEKGMQHTRRWLWVPEDEPGEYPLQIEVRDQDDNVLAVASTVIHVAPRDAGVNRELKLLCIGDSLTAASIYTGELLELFKRPENPGLRLLGTRQLDPKVPENRNEGYGGWKFESFTSKWNPDALPDAMPSTGSSPFLFLEDEEPILSVRRYLDEKLDGVVPDIVLIKLGINDVFLANEKTRHTIVENTIEHARRLIDSIREAVPRALIGIVLPVPPSTSQDSFGETNGNLQTRWGYLKNRHLLMVRLIEVFGTREWENIHIVPAYHNLDSDNNFPTVERSANAHNQNRITVCNNEVHPSPSGYYQIADSLYGWLKYQMEKAIYEDQEDALVSATGDVGASTNGNEVFLGSRNLHESTF
jgi:lysophospholipase L1-like esterase